MKTKFSIFLKKGFDPDFNSPSPEILFHNHHRRTCRSEAICAWKIRKTIFFSFISQKREYKTPILLTKLCCYINNMFLFGYMDFTLIIQFYTFCKLNFHNAGSISHNSTIIRSTKNGNTPTTTLSSKSKILSLNQYSHSSVRVSPSKHVPPHYF